MENIYCLITDGALKNKAHPTIAYLDFDLHHIAQIVRQHFRWL